MKTKLHCLYVTLALFAALNCVNAQNTEFTYQGRVTDHGTNFTGVGQFQFSLAYTTNTSSQATAGVPDIAFAGNIEDIPVNNGGSGYVTAPTVTITSSSGSGATATASISGGSVVSINVINGGSGYPVPQYYPGTTTITIAPPPANYTNVSVWNNDGTSGGKPSAAVNVAVTTGLFTLVLGDSTLSNMTAIPAALFSQFTYPNLFLQIWFNDGVNGFAALSPVQPLTPTPVSVFANTASNLLGSLRTSQLSGSIPGGSISGTIPAASLTSVPAGNLTGTLPAAVLPAPLVLPNGLNLDVTGTYGQNAGTVRSNALAFGTGPGGSGEGIASKRTGTNPFDLEFFTGFVNRMTILASGNVGIGTTNPANLLVVGGSASPAYCNGTTWQNGSDRNIKQDFSPVSPQTVLARVSALPITEWQYKMEAAGTKHIGPMAQDFHAAFGLNGGDDTHISTVDEGGVALAAIQGLNQKVEEKDAEIQDLKARLEKLERLMNHDAAK